MVAHLCQSKKVKKKTWFEKKKKKNSEKNKITMTHECKIW